MHIKEDTFKEILKTECLNTYNYFHNPGNTSQNTWNKPILCTWVIFFLCIAIISQTEKPTGLTIHPAYIDFSLHNGRQFSQRECWIGVWLGVFSWFLLLLCFGLCLFFCRGFVWVLFVLFLWVDGANQIADFRNTKRKEYLHMHTRIQNPYCKMHFPVIPNWWTNIFQHDQVEDAFSVAVNLSSTTDIKKIFIGL